MTPAISRLCAAVAAAVLLAGPAAAAPPSAADLDHFEKKIRPVLVEHCYSLPLGRRRGEQEAQGRPAASTPATGLLKGGDTGPAVVPGKPDESLLLKALRYDGDVQMPPKGKLPDAVIADFETWVADGRRRPARRRPRPQGAGRHRPRGRAGSSGPTSRRRRRRCPRSRTPPGRANDIDRFVLAELEAKGLKPVADADRADAGPPALLRPHRPAADARGGRRVRRRRRRRTPTRSWSIGCSRRRTSASAGAGTGSTSPASPSR